MSGQRFSVLHGSWAVARLPAAAPIPPWVRLDGEDFSSITRTGDELSIVSPQDLVPSGVQAERGWSILKLLGPFPFDEVGVLASFARPLASMKISILAIGTFDTDYILIKSADVAAACECLTAAGHTHVP
jgi:uncharacterized protein